MNDKIFAILELKKSGRCWENGPPPSRGWSCAGIDAGNRYRNRAAAAVMRLGGKRTDPA